MRRAINLLGSWTLRLLLLSIVALVGLLAWIVSSESGTATAWRFSQTYLPELIQIKKLEGRIAGPLHLNGLQLRLDNLEVDLAEADIQWDLTTLWHGLLDVPQLHARGLHIRSRASGEPPSNEPIELPELSLPLEINIADLQLEEASLQLLPAEADMDAPSPEPILLNQLQAAARWDPQGFALQLHSLQAPLLDLQGQAQLDPQGGWPLGAKLAFTLRLPELAPLTGHAELAGPLTRLRLPRLELAAPYALRASGSLGDVLNDILLNVKAQLDGTQLARIRPDLPVLRLQAGVTAAGPLDKLQLGADVIADEPQYGRLLAKFSGSWLGDALRVRKLQLSPADSAADLNASGDVALGGSTPRFDLKAHWSKLRWPLASQKMPAQWRSSAGSVSFVGPLDAYRVQLQAELEAVAQGRATVTAKGHGDLQRFTLEQLLAKALGGELKAQAQVAWADAVVVTGKVNGQQLNPALLAPEWPGNIDLQTQLSLRSDAQGLTLKLPTLMANGKLRGYPLTLDAALSWANEQLKVPRAELVSGATRLTASGHMGPQNDLSFRLVSTDMGSLLPDAGGRVDAAGQVTGTLEVPHLQLQLDAEAFRWNAYSVAELALSADLNLQDGQQSILQLQARGGGMPGLSLNELTVQGSGKAEQHSLDILADSSQGRLATNGGGSWNATQQRWEFRIGKAELQYPRLAAWQLQDGMSGWVAANGHAFIERHCWQTGEASACLSGRFDDVGPQAAFNLADLPFSHVQPLMGRDFLLNGSVSAEGGLQPDGDAVAVEATLQTSAGNIVADETGQTALEFAPSRASFKLDAAGMAALLRLELGGADHVLLDARVPAGAGDLGAQPLVGEMSLLLADLGFVAGFSPELEAVKGRVEGRFQLGGTLAAPRADGQFALTGGEANLVTPGLRLREFSGQMQADSDGNLRLTSSVVSGLGKMQLNGKASLLPKLSLDMSLTGKDFQVLSNEEASASITPDLKLVIRERNVDLTGELRVPHADIAPRQLPEGGGVSVSGDRIVVSEETPIEIDDNPWQLNSRVRLILGDDVHFEGFGLAAQFGGSVLTVGKPGQVTTGSGELVITKGRYQAYGQDLTVENGKLIFAGGPVAEPGLDIRAVRRPEPGVLVGVKVRGPLRQPELTLFSEPSFTQAEQLSWLVLGRALKGGTQSENSALNQAALAIGLKGGQFLADRLGGRLGFDDVSVGAEPGQNADQAALTIGKYLSPKLYLSYGIGLFEPISTLRLRYMLSKSWRFVSESSTVGSGGDLLYSIERK